MLKTVSRIPFTLVMLTVWCYWTSVVLMILRSRLKLRSASGALPRSTLERGLWLFWVPIVIAWQVLPDMAFTSSYPFLRAPQWIVEHPPVIVNWLAVVAAVTSYVLTVPCWLAMGSNWSLAVVPGKQTSLITDGFYARVRHPIYALGLLLMGATVVVAPSPAVLLVGLGHLSMVLLKAANEERFLRDQHGQRYLDYCQRTGRFLPWPARRAPTSAAR